MFVCNTCFNIQNSAFCYQIILKYFLIFSAEEVTLSLSVSVCTY